MQKMESDKMNKNEFEILNAIRKFGRISYRELSSLTKVSLGNVSNIIKCLNERNLIDINGITELGNKALLPYKVNNAVILAAGPSSRFVPLSLELPKGLFKVKDEILIERQIKQLHEVGIKDITIVLGYKKELFFYLKEKYNVNFVINDEFNKKNNIESLYRARKYINSTYICSCDDYFTINPFDKYEFQTFYASIYCPVYKKEFYVKTNKKLQITEMNNGQEKGDILLGHSYWNKNFSSQFLKLIDECRITGEYDGNFWEKLLSDNLKRLPQIYIKKYPENTIFEFDFVSELREFDDKYVNNTESKIMANICLVLKCDEKEITGFKPIHEGMTNTSFIFKVKEKSYVYRQPGDGTDEIIDRKHEKIVLELAKKYNFDSTFIYMNPTEGWKISSFVDEFREPSYDSFDDSKKILDVLKELHSTNVKEINWIFEPISEADRLEEIIKNKSSIQMKDFETIKKNVHTIYENTKNDGIEKCWCHSDTYKPNWMITKDKTILIDWEYSGISDPGIDVGYYIVDAMYDFDKTEEFVKYYCGDKYNNITKYHYFAYIAIIAYYWFVWALYRETCGAVIGESLYNWYVMAKKYSEYVINNLDKNEQPKKVLSRSEFELLNYVFNNKFVENNARFLSNALLLSESNIKEAINCSLDKNYIKLKNGKLYLNDLGQKVLDAYGVSKAIIMAAGFGSRMAPVTLERPKPLVKVNGVRIIDTLIDSLLSKGINEIYIVRGYKKEKFDELLEKYPFIKFIDNDDYNVTNNISSIMKAIDYLDNCYICEADFLVSNQNVISKYHYFSNYLGARVLETDDWCFRIVDGFAYDYKKGNVNCYQAYGISYWNHEDSMKLKKYLPLIFESKEGKQQFWESCVFDFYKDKFKVEIKSCSKFDIVEIDCFEELVEIDQSYKDYKLNK